VIYSAAAHMKLQCSNLQPTLCFVSVDIAVTQDYYVVVVGPVDFSPSKFITEYVTSRCSIAECLQYDPNQQKIPISRIT